MPGDLDSSKRCRKESVSCEFAFVAFFNSSDCDNGLLPDERMRSFSCYCSMTGQNVQHEFTILGSVALNSPEVHFPPPLLFFAAIGFAVAIEYFVPTPLSHLVRVPGQLSVGCTAIGIGICLLCWAMCTFRLSKTAIYPNQSAKKLVARGPYRFSRNPMYVALTAIHVGVSLLADNLWMCLLLPVVLTALWKSVIQREEAYLAEAFGDTYQAYCNDVRRWL